MELKQSFTINGEIVVPTGKKLGNLTIYQNEKEFDDLTLHFVDDKGKVVGSLNVEAEMSQGMGYISDWSVK